MRHHIHCRTRHRGCIPPLPPLGGGGVEMRFARSGLVAGNSGYWLVWGVVAREDARYANRLKGSVRPKQKLVGVLRSEVWVIVVVTCVIFNAIH